PPPPFGGICGVDWRGRVLLRARRPDLLGALLTLLAGGPELVARLGLLHRDRRGALDQEVDRLAHRDVLAEALVAALRPRPVERLDELLVGRGGSAAGGHRLPQRVEQLLVGD